MRRATLLWPAAAVLLAGCGPSSPPASASSANVDHIWHEAAQCVRDHGVPDFPDPIVDDAGRGHLPPGTAEPPEAAVAACQSILNQLPPQDRPDATSAPESVAMLRQFSACMRQHGVSDWPDPGADGAFRFPPSLQGNLKTGPRAPAIRTAMSACARYNPSGRIEVVQ